MQSTNYKGNPISVINADTAEDCCSECFVNPNCNVFVYCGKPAGCRNANINVISYRSCTLKYFATASSGGSIDAWASGSNVDFSSGSLVY